MTGPGDSQDFMVTAEDVLAAGFCIIPGLKGFLEDRGYNLRTFIREKGLPSQTMLGFKDARADRAVAKARERLNRG